MVFSALSFIIGYLNESLIFSNPLVYLLLILISFIIGIYNYFDARKKQEVKTLRIMNLIFALIAISLIFFCISVFLTAVNSGV